MTPGLRAAEKHARRDTIRRSIAVDIARAEAELAAETRRFDIVLADPPWTFKVYNELTGSSRAVSNHYPTMTLDAIKHLRPPASKNAILLLWAPNPHLKQAIDVMEAWGFKYKSNYVWTKDKFGTGYWNRSQHETLLVGTRGKFRAPHRMDWKQRRQRGLQPAFIRMNGKRILYPRFELFTWLRDRYVARDTQQAERRIAAE
jgi:hypothetical protein